MAVLAVCFVTDSANAMARFIGETLDPTREVSQGGKNGFPGSGVTIETYYGFEAKDAVKKRAKELGLHLAETPIWVEPSEMWKYTKQEPEKLILL